MPDTPEGFVRPLGGGDEGASFSAPAATAGKKHEGAPAPPPHDTDVGGDALGPLPASPPPLRTPVATVALPALHGPGDGAAAVEPWSRDAASVCVEAEGSKQRPVSTTLSLTRGHNRERERERKRERVGERQGGREFQTVMESSELSINNARQEQRGNQRRVSIKLLFRAWPGWTGCEHFIFFSDQGI